MGFPKGASIPFGRKGEFKPRSRIKLIVLLAGGTKRTQKADIKRAKALAALLD